eukprot:883056-Amphidinium_carterae.1
MASAATDFSKLRYLVPDYRTVFHDATLSLLNYSVHSKTRYTAHPRMPLATPTIDTTLNSHAQHTWRYIQLNVGKSRTILSSISLLLLRLSNPYANIHSTEYPHRRRRSLA